MGLAAIDLAVGETVSAAVMFPAVEEETGMLSEEARVATTDPALGRAAVAARRAWGAAEAAAAVEAEAGEAEAGEAGADVVDERPLVQ